MGASNRTDFLSQLKAALDVDRYEIYSGIVSSVDENNATCDVLISDELTIYDVRLRAVIDSPEGMYIVPAIDSPVVIAQIDNGQDFAMLQAAKVKKVIVKIGSISMAIDNTGAIFNNGLLGGLPMLLPLLQKINALESKVNTLTTSYNGHIHPVSGSSTGAASIPVIGTLPVTQRSDLENTKVKQ